MRVTSGILRNMPLMCPAGKNTRPTPDKIRQAIFNGLAESLEGAHVLDLFAGTGAMGIEAVSRGAAQSTFVESDHATLDALRKNLTEARRRFSAQNLAEPCLQVVKGILPQGLANLPQAVQFQLIWMDPPYPITLSVTEAILPEIFKSLSDGGILAIESEKSDQQALITVAQRVAPSLSLAKEKAYGRTGVTIWTKIG